ncbi:cytochrome aa3 quinol oxidase subunit II [Scopulibacillus cellulosilyticus]|uniref:Quinol oxidase subunit 2 n=1 Tax=Scopulibacillus cellulosilyticus TaxID=2665665 RepID=A0ABW2Q210_9BACL
MKKLGLKSFAALTLLLVSLTGCAADNQNVLDPQGPVARTQFHLIVWSFILMALVVLGVFIIFIVVLVKNGKKNNPNYDPEDDGNVKLEVTWTVIPIIIVILLAIPTVKSTYDLEKPPKTAEAKTPMTIVVTSADWKWVFRYPEQNIETVNYVAIPSDRPIKFQLQAKGAMNSFWVPSLGGQAYTMPNMKMSLWLQADHPGDYLGRGANFTGKGFAHMQFHVLAKSDSDFNKWVQHVKSTAPPITQKKYDEIMKPGTVGRMTFSSTPKDDRADIDMSSGDMSGMDMGGMHHGQH